MKPCLKYYPISHIDSKYEGEESSQDDQGSENHQESEINDESQSPPISLQPTQNKKRSVTCLDNYMDLGAAFPGAGSGFPSRRAKSRFVGRTTSSR